MLQPYNSAPTTADPTLMRVISSSDTTIKSVAANYYDTSWEGLGKELLKNVVFGILTGGIYSLYSIGNSLYTMWTAESRMQEEGESVNDLLLAVDDLDANSVQAQFQFKGQNHTLEEVQYAGKHDLHLKNDQGVTLHTFENHTLNELRQRVSLFRIYSQLSPEAKKAFLPLFNLPHIGNVDANSPIVSGDLDGSTARQVLLGIQAGIIEINDEGRACLARVINEEAKVLAILNSQDQITEETRSALDQHEQRALVNRKKDALLDFQRNQAVQGDMEALATHLTYKPCHTSFISIGDGIHDRFSNNKDVDRQIREEMHNNGAIFITGNHDVFHQKGDYQFGKMAKDNATPQDWKDHQDTVLSNACFHEETNTLYLHHGIEEDDFGTIQTAFGTYEVPETGFDLRHFLTWINAEERRPLPLKLVQATVGTSKGRALAHNEERYEALNKFRPTEEAIQQIANKWGIRIVHGHSGVIDSSRTHVIGLNSRTNDQGGVEGGSHAVVAARIGEYRPTTTLSPGNHLLRKMLVDDDEMPEAVELKPLDLQLTQEKWTTMGASVISSLPEESPETSLSSSSFALVKKALHESFYKGVYEKATSSIPYTRSVTGEKEWELLLAKAEADRDNFKVTYGNNMEEHQVYRIYDREAFNTTHKGRLQFVVTSGAGAQLFKDLEEALESFITNECDGDAVNSPIHSFKVLSEPFQAGRSDSGIFYMSETPDHPLVQKFVLKYLNPKIQARLAEPDLMGLRRVGSTHIHGVAYPDARKAQNIFGERASTSNGGLMTQILSAAYLQGLNSLQESKEISTDEQRIEKLNLYTQIHLADILKELKL